MKVSGFCQRNPITVRPDDELLSAAKVMRDQHVGYLVVVEPAVRDGAFRPVGVLTDRDIVVSLLARDADPRALRVNDVMTREPVVCEEELSLGQALKSMRRIGVRRLPVIGKDRHLTGVIALDDIIDALVGELEDAAGAVRSEQLIEHVLHP